MKNLEKRFKIIALLIISNDKFAVLDDKIAIVADAIDCNFPEAEKMLCFLENSVLKLSELPELIKN
jgi:hypothetical protein